MPETGELVHNEKWLNEKIRQFIFYVSLVCDQPMERSLIEHSVAVHGHNDYENNRRLGTEVLIKTKDWPDKIKNKVVDGLMQIRFPGVDITEGRHHSSHWRIETDVTKPDAQLHYPDGLVTPLIRKLNDYFDDLNHRVATESVLPKRIGQLAQRIPGADSSKIEIKVATDDEHFSNRVTVTTSDISDPVWQKLAKAFTVVQHSQFCGKDLRWHNPFIFEHKEGGTIPVSVSGPLVAVRNALDSVAADIAPDLDSLNVDRQLG